MLRHNKYGRLAITLAQNKYNDGNTLSYNLAPMFLYKYNPCGIAVGDIV